MSSSLGPQRHKSYWHFVKDVWIDSLGFFLDTAKSLYKRAILIRDSKAGFGPAMLNNLAMLGYAVLFLLPLYLGAILVPIFTVWAVVTQIDHGSKRVELDMSWSEYGEFLLPHSLSKSASAHLKKRENTKGEETSYRLTKDYPKILHAARKNEEIDRWFLESNSFFENHLKRKGGFEGLPWGPGLPLPEQNTVLNTFIAEYLVASHLEWKTKKDSTWKKPYELGPLFLVLIPIIFVVIPCFFWNRFWLLSFFGLIVWPFGEKRLAELAEFSNQGKGKWKTFLSAFLLIPFVDSILNVMVLGIDIPPNTMALLNEFGWHPGRLSIDLLIVVFGSTLVTTAFYQFLDLFVRACLLVCKLPSQTWFARIVSNIVAFVILHYLGSDFIQLLAAVAVALLAWWLEDGLLREAAEQAA